MRVGFMVRPWAVVGAVALAACSLDVDVPQDPAWEATLAPLSTAVPVTGEAAAITRQGGTEVSIRVDGETLEEGVELEWHVRAGSCSSSGERLGPAAAYPALVMSDAEPSEQYAAVPARMLPGSTYSVEVLDSPDPDATVLACGVFEPWQG